ncbi:hypothetical protein LJB42_003182 [Komagataella kurtzmanii]|nr:hypothetical protein LJB42_003182 [Komagataella kurtzmanii]
MSKKLIVFGGNGFLGKRICQEGIKAGFKVVSLSSSGKSPTKILPSDDEWVQKVQWKKADVFKPESYKDILKDANAVVHSIGILLENAEYKKAINSNNDLLGEIMSFFQTSNPMTKNVSNSYDAVNRESAVLLAQTLIESKGKVPKSISKAPAFVYISADQQPPFIPSGYLESKRKAEFELYQLQPGIRPVLMRPSFMFDEHISGDVRSKLKDLIKIGDQFNQKILNNALKDIIRPTVSTNQVAKSVIEKINDPEYHGPVLLEEIV